MTLHCLKPASVLLLHVLLLSITNTLCQDKRSLEFSNDEKVFFIDYHENYNDRVKAMGSKPSDVIGQYAYLHVAGPPVVINAVAPAGISVSTSEGNTSKKEMIQLINVGRDDVVLDDWKMVDQNGNTFTFGSERACPQAIIRQNEKRTMFRGDRCSYKFGLSAKNDSLRLLNPQGKKVDWTTWSLDPSSEQMIWARSPAGFGNFKTVDESAFELVSDDGRLKEDMSRQSKVRISKLSPKSGEDIGDWLSIINNSSEPMDMRGWMLSNDEETYTFGLHGGKLCPYPVIHPGEEMVLFSKVPCSIPFALKAKSDLVQLKTPEGQVVQNAMWNFDDFDEGTFLVADGSNPNTLELREQGKSTHLDSAQGVFYMKPLLSINRVQTGKISKDWVEIKLSSDFHHSYEGYPMNISGFKISESSNPKDKGYFLIGGEDDACLEHLRHVSLKPSSAITFVRDEPCSFEFGFKAKEGTLFLFDQKDVLVDSVYWQLKDSEDALLQREDDMRLSPVEMFTDEVSGVVSNVQAGQQSIKLNEIVPKSSDHADAVELFNPSDEPISLENWTLLNANTDTFQEQGNKVDISFVDEKKIFHIGKGECKAPIVQPKGFLILFRDDPCSFTFGLSPSDSVALLDGSYRVVDAVSWSSVGEDQAHARVRDGLGDFNTTTSITLGTSNAITGLRPLDYKTSAICTQYNDTHQVGLVKSNQIGEASGVVPSVANEDVLWMHIDGFYPRLYAVSSSYDAKGKILAEIELPFSGLDFEDIALAGCPHMPQANCLFLGDIGDNCARRNGDGSSAFSEEECKSEPFHSVWAFPEPELERRGGLEETAAENASVPVIAVKPMDVHHWNFIYPFGAMDAESLLISPEGDRMWIIEKKNGDGEVRIVSNVHGYDLSSQSSGQFVPVSQIATMKNPGKKGSRGAITGADFHPTGQRLLLVTAHQGTFEYPIHIPYELSTMARKPLRVAGVQDHFYQYEGVAYDRQDQGVWQVSEMPGGWQPLEYTECASLDLPHSQGQGRRR